MKTSYAAILILVLCAACINADIPHSHENLSPLCSLNCEKCEGPFYNTSAQGACTTRSDRNTTWYTFDIFCWLSGAQEIRDEESCHSVNPQDISSKKFKVLGVFDHEWIADEGCFVKAENARFAGLRKVTGKVCFGLVRWKFVIISQLAAVVAGGTLGILSGVNSRRHVTQFIDHLVDSNDRWHEFGPGAKVVAKNTIISPGRVRYILLYRFTQVVANLWLPMTLYWVFNQTIVTVACIVLYGIPAFCAMGCAVFTQPHFYISPGHCSLLGIRMDQRVAKLEYLISFMRPPLLIGGVYAITEAVIGFGIRRRWETSDITAMAINKEGFFNLGFQNWWGEWLTNLILMVTAVGTILFMLLTIRPVLKALFDMDTEGDYIVLEEDTELQFKFQSLAEHICNAAGEDDEWDEDRVDKLNVATQSYAATIFYLLIAVVDLLAYFYRIYVFVFNSRYVLAFLMSFACVESITTLWWNRHFQFARKAIRRTSVTGVPTVNYLALCQWDDGMAGIPSLMLSIYGLPMLKATPLSSLSSAFFLFTGTKALACYLADVVDSGMYEMVPDDQYKLIRKMSATARFFAHE